jgi:hypothetical protein
MKDNNVNACFLCCRREAKNDGPTIPVWRLSVIEVTASP